MTEHKEFRVRGLPVNEGIAVGTLYLLASMEEMIPESPIALCEVDGGIDGEIKRFRHALLSSRKDLEKLQSALAKEGSGDAATIIDTHIQMLDDPLITTHVEEKIRQMKQNTESVFRSVIGEFERCFPSDTFFRRRLIDVMDVSKRILEHLRNKQRVSLEDIPFNSVVFAKELAPSQAASVCSSRVSGFVTELGGGNSHAALIARAKGIPFVAAVELQGIERLKGSCVIVDGISGEVIFNPSEATLGHYQRQRSLLNSEREILVQQAVLESVTRDGTRVELLANVGALSELDKLGSYGAEGIGLFRSEYLLLDDSAHFPSEEEQYRVYMTLLRKMQGKPLVIRAFDIGGDKISSIFFEMRKEPNPVLGCRGIRFLLQTPEVFRTQLRALIRAAGEGSLSLLLPLVSDLTELRQAKAIIEAVKAEVGFSGELPLGCMLEVPSAVLISEAIANECDFLSVGTNDLVQYTLGIDRSNPVMGSLNCPAHPSVVRLIKLALDGVGAVGRSLCLCGELASNPLITPLLVGLGMRQFSCALPYLPLIKKRIRTLSLPACQELAQTALQLSTSEEMVELLNAFDAVEV